MVRASRHNILGGLAALVVAACGGSGSDSNRIVQTPVPTPAPTAPAPTPTPTPTPNPPSTPAPVPRAPPVHGYTAGIGDTHVVVEDYNADQLLSVDIQTGTSTILVDPYQNFRTSTQGNVYYFVQGVNGSNVFLSRNTQSGQQSNSDVVILAKDGTIVVDTNTPTAQEYIDSVLDNGTVLMNIYNPQTFSTQFGILDTQTQAMQNIFPDNPNNPAARRAFHHGERGDHVFLFTEEGTTFTAHEINRRNGNERLLTTIDSAVTSFSHFDAIDRDVVVFFRYQSNGELVFRHQGTDTVFQVPNVGLDYDALASMMTPFGQLRVIVREQDWSTNTTKLLGMLTASGTTSPFYDTINFSAFTGWEPFGYRDSVADAGDRLVAIEGNGPDPLPRILFYDRFRNRVEDRLTPLLPASITEIDARMESYKGKALIQVEARTSTGRSIDKVVIFDGNDVIDQFGAYNDARMDKLSHDGRYGLIEATTRYITGSSSNPQQHAQSDLILWDLETQTQTPISTILDGSFASAYADDGQRIAYATQDHQTQRSEVWVHNIATGSNEKVYEGRNIGFIPQFKNDKIIVRSYGAPNEDILLDLSRRHLTTNLAEATVISEN